MKQGSNNRRSRSRGGNKRNSGGGRNSFESNGPDVKIRGTAQQVQEKYQALARDSASSGDRITAEAYLQFAEHYYRVSNPEGGNGKGQGQNQGHTQGQNQIQGQNKPRRGDKPQARPEPDAAAKAPANTPDEAGAPESEGEAEVVDTSPAALAAAVAKREAAETEVGKSSDASSDAPSEPATS